MKIKLLVCAIAFVMNGVCVAALAASDKTAAPIDAKSGQSTADKTSADKAAADKGAAGKDQAAEPVSTEPELTTASFGDWTMRCHKGPAAAPAKNCEIFVDLMVQGQQGAVAEIAIGRLQKDGPYRVTVVLPNNVTFATPGALAFEGAGSAKLDLVWARCLPTGCFASAALTEQDLAHLRDAKAKAALQWQMGTGQGVSLPFSQRGFAQAFESLNNAID